MSEFHDRLREERKRTGLTQSDLAVIGGVQKNAQSLYESGARKPDSDYLQAIAAAGIDVVYVMLGRRVALLGETLSEAESLLLARWRSGSPALRGYLQEFGQAPGSGGNTVTIGGDVGQQVNGDQTITSPMTFKVGGKRK
ncbi:MULTISPECIES: helix-turn-helix domain-containing protein [unclassified Acidovorax]|uniref:helix-turn-helix domain-containing protein n=1 Tax=unclassified Acidovorax TaxID=2684926 RepID=UPI001C495BF1|nr:MULTISPECIES: helix-turn-helix transcriptional regulator [unclassified Acidovorax]MBV7460470.1 helix-turn-helix domain-containing protein [Acidovorax sp. sif0632]MBV7465495.1 helix-turn-helix domain-containing protein [Acidovorax sp. sif0613]